MGCFRVLLLGSSYQLSGSAQITAAKALSRRTGKNSQLMWASAVSGVRTGRVLVRASKDLKRHLKMHSGEKLNTCNQYHLRQVESAVLGMSEY